MGQCPDNDVRSEPKSFQSLFLGIVMHLGVGPPVAWICFVCIIENESAVAEQAEALRRLAIVFVCFGRPGGKLKLTVVQSEAKGQLDKVLVRKHFPDLPSKRLVQTVIVVHVQEAAVVKIRPEPADLFVRQRDVPVSGDKKERGREDLIPRNVSKPIARICLDACRLLHKPQ